MSANEDVETADHKIDQATENDKLIDTKPTDNDT